VLEIFLRLAPQSEKAPCQTDFLESTFQGENAKIAHFAAGYESLPDAMRASTMARRHGR
jgi:hypothetical protein